MYWKTFGMLLVITVTAGLSASPIVGQLAINSALGGNFAVGQNWTLSLTGAKPDIPLTICAAKDDSAASCTPNFGRTDQTGSWQMSGKFDFNTAGKWTEWVVFPSGAVSNRISFTISGIITGKLSVNSALGGNFAVGQNWTLSLTGAPPNSPFDICGSQDNNAPACVPNFGSTDASGSWTLSGSFATNTEGGWTEWLRFSSGYTSNLISFTVGTAITYQTTGLDVGFFLSDQSPYAGVPLDRAQIIERLVRIAPYTRWIRTYGSTQGLENVPDVAKALGLKVAFGIWLNDNGEANEKEISGAIAAKQNGKVDMLIVGSETLFRNDLSEAQLIGYLSRVKQAAPNTIVTTADTYQMLLSHPNVVAYCDLIMMNDFPYWDGRTISQATASLNEDYATLKKRYPQKEIWVSETGWPSGGNTMGGAVPSEQNAAAYFLNFVSWARALNVNYFYFEAYDEPWKIRDEGPQGAFWGVWQNNGILKPGMLEVFKGATVTNNWTDIGFLLPGGNGTPAIQFTHVPPRGTYDNLSGVVLHLKPSDYYVAVFLHVNGGWWTKPYWDSPRTKINSDGTWSCDVTTGGVDDQADTYAAIVLPNSYNVPLAYGYDNIPISNADAVVSASVGR